MITTFSVSFIAFLLANSVAHCESITNGHVSAVSHLSNGSAVSDLRRNARSSSSSHVIPAWKIGLVSNEQGQGNNWFERLGISTPLGGSYAALKPIVSSSVGQDQQRCPVLKLPEQVVTSVSSNSWSSLEGGWATPSGVQIATFDQSFITLQPWADINVSRRPVNFRAVSSGYLAVRARAYTDAAMRYFFNWRPEASINMTQNFSRSALAEEEPICIALLDCVGNLMYVARAASDYVITIYDNKGSSLTSAVVEHPVVRMQFGYPKNDYLIATAEAPNIGAKTPEYSIPKDALQGLGNVLPFGIKFAPGGYKGASLLMDPEFRWIIAIAVQAFAIYRGEDGRISWAALTVSWILVIALWILSCAAIVAVAFMIYRCVYPHHEDVLKDHHGKIADNPFLAVPERPPQKNKQFGAYPGASTMRYGSLV